MIICTKCSFLLILTLLKSCEVCGTSSSSGCLKRNKIRFCTAHSAPVPVVAIYQSRSIPWRYTHGKKCMKTDATWRRTPAPPTQHHAVISRSLSTFWQEASLRFLLSSPVRDLNCTFFVVQNRNITSLFPWPPPHTHTQGMHMHNTRSTFPLDSRSVVRLTVTNSYSG